MDTHDSEPAGGLSVLDVPCPICGGRDSTPYSEENGFPLVRCAGCGLLYVTPRPDPAATSAAHEYGLHHGDATLEITGRYRPDRIAGLRRTLTALYGPALPPGVTSWLDVGCGHGEFLTALQRFAGPGVTTVGLEPNRTKAAGCVQRGLDVRSLGLDEVDGRYSVVSLLNVFSHLQDPRSFLADCVERIEPGGELLIETGDTAGLSADEHPRPLFLPDHLLFADEPLVRRVLTDVGLEVVATHHGSAAAALPLQVLGECRRAVQRRQAPPVVAASRRWRQERRRRIDLWVRARRID
jgi:SAM-dependent methyltransferase